MAHRLHFLSHSDGGIIYETSKWCIVQFISRRHLWETKIRKSHRTGIISLRSDAEQYKQNGYANDRDPRAQGICIHFEDLSTHHQCDDVGIIRIQLIKAILTDAVARNKHRIRSESNHRQSRWRCRQTIVNQGRPKPFIHTCSTASLSVQVLGPDTLGHASPAVGSIEGYGLRANVPVPSIRWLDIVLGDPVQALSPAGVVGWVRTGVGTSWRVRLEDQEVTPLAQVVVHIGPPGEVERDWDRSVVGGTARAMGL